MGDRTTVNLTVLLEDEVLVRTFLRVDERQEDFSGFVIYLTYYEVNYGELFFLPKLREMCIPYIVEWERGSEYGAGTEFYMFNEEGEVETLSYYDDDMTPSLERLLLLCDKPYELVRFIRTYRDRFKHPRWSIQREKSFIARAKKLIGA